MVTLNLKLMKDLCKGIVKDNVALSHFYIGTKVFLQKCVLKIKPDKRTFLSQQYLSGHGIEIGALHLPLVLPWGAHVKYIDRMTVKELRQEYPELIAFPLVLVDIIDDGEKLEKIESESQDFVIANHFLEHCENPIGAIESFLRVLKKAGILYMAVPDKRFTFDIDRPITKLEHILEDYNDGGVSSRMGHYLEWVHFIDAKSEATLEGRAESLINSRSSIHFHVWTYLELFELIIYMKRHFNFDFEVKEFAFTGNEFIFIIGKN